MKTLTKPRPRFLYREHFAVPHDPKLIGQWQHGIETISGHGNGNCISRSRIRRHQPSRQLTTTNSYDRNIDFSNGNGHLPVRRIRRFA